MYTVATPAPTPTSSSTPAPTPTPTTTPSPQPVFVYQGNYSVTHNNSVETTGCAFLVTSQDGSPLSGTPYSGANADQPIFNVLVNSTLVKSGFVSSMTINNLSATGGSGSFTLDDGSTGTITLTERTALPSSRAARYLIHHH
jgi:hypothetical protein